METIYKYVCEKCNIKCNDESRWKKHIETEKHKTGIKKKRSDTKEPYKCDKCEYKTKFTTSFKQHKLNEHKNKEEREDGFKFYCSLCDYGTFSVDFYEKHVKTNNHIKHKKNYE